MFKSIREVNIAVRNLDDAVKAFSSRLGLETSSFNEDPRPPVQSRSATFPIGESCLALMESTAQGSPIDRFLKWRGEGLFSVSLQVRNLEETTMHLRQRGVQLILNNPMLFHEFVAYDRSYALAKMNFIRPSSLHGVLIEVQELVQ